ncbi:MAG: DUF2085 domain-containing protein [Candidatus Promineifilaceae bacterium]|nr:DUF2085 domain-containing protein [Candidatus Promineifilaceae bacterium]
MAQGDGRLEELPRRLIPLLIVLASLLVLGFYTVTDTGRLVDHAALEGADVVGYAICHRITDRSFSIADRQLPLCARCTGIYLGISLTFGLLFLAGRTRRTELPSMKLLLVMVSLVGLMGIDGFNSYSHFFPDAPHLYEPRNWLRLLTGMGAGLAMGAIVFPGLNQTLWREQVRLPSLENGRELAALIALALGLVGLVLSNQPLLLYVLGIVSAVGVLMVLTAINTMSLLIIIKRDAQADTGRQAIAPLLIGLTLALIEVGVISYIRYAYTGTMTGFPGL